MTAAAPSAALATIQPVFTHAGRVAVAGFLAGYRGLTREACVLDLRQFTSWCRTRSVVLFAVRRAGIETFARDLEARGRARATVTRRVSTIAGFRNDAVQEELLDRSPAAHVRRPRADCESHAVALDRNEPGALLATAGLGPPLEHALISLLALNGLRVSEATGADIEHLGLERGHRTVTITRKGGKVVTIPLHLGPAGHSTWSSANAPRDRCSWPLTAGGWTGTPPGGSSAGPPAAPGPPSSSPRTRCGMCSSPRFKGAGVPLRDVQEAASHADPRTTKRYDTLCVNLVPRLAVRFAWRVRRLRRAWRGRRGCPGASRAR